MILKRIHLYVLLYFLCWKNFVFMQAKYKKSKHKQNKTIQNKNKTFYREAFFDWSNQTILTVFCEGGLSDEKKMGWCMMEPSTRTIFILIFGLQVKKAFRTLNMHSWVVMYTYNSKFRHIYNCCYVFGQACILFLIKMTVGTE